MPDEKKQDDEKKTVLQKGTIKAAVTAVSNAASGANPAYSPIWAAFSVMANTLIDQMKSQPKTPEFNKAIEETSKTISHEHHIKIAEPIDWNFNCFRFYDKEDFLWWKVKENDTVSEPIYLPQNILITPIDSVNEEDFSVILNSQKYEADRVKSGLDFHEKFTELSDKAFHDGECVRLEKYDAANKTFYFQNTGYYDYVATNMSLDINTPAAGRLRDRTVKEGKVRSLETIPLTNVVGINSLVFTSDGHMVIQRRNDTVLVRPGELCSGFSGTVEQPEIEYVVANLAETNSRFSRFNFAKEGSQEIALRRDEITKRRFLGVTRELVRGGAPEFFYSADVSITSADLLRRRPESKEGTVLVVPLNGFGKTELSAINKEYLPERFTHIINEIYRLGNTDIIDDEEVERQVKSAISLPLMTNLVLWYWSNCPEFAGTGLIPQEQAG
jgi:hypothetical protein